MGKNFTYNNLEFLKTLEQFTIESKLLMCQKYSCRLMTRSKVDIDRAIEENIMPWEIEVFAAYSIVYDNDEAKKEVDVKTFFNIITQIRNYWHDKLTEAKRKGEFSEAFIMISVLQQFPVQGVFLQKLFRYHYFFTFYNEKIDMRKVFMNKIGVNYEKLEEFAFLIFVGFSEEAQDLIPATKLQSDLIKIFSDQDVLRLLSIEKEDYKKKLFSLYNNITDQYYGLKIQYIYPFIAIKDYIYIPSPYLIINAVTESMLNRVTLNDNKIRRIIGKEVIENYVYNIVKELNTVTWISREFEYFKGKKLFLSPDVIAEEDDMVIFYDTKAITPSLKLRKFDTKEIEKYIKIYATDVIQIYNQIKNYLNGFFKLNKVYMEENIFGIVVVLEDAVMSRKRIYDRAISMLLESDTVSQKEKDYICSHIKVLPLSVIECMVLQNTSLLPQLQLQLSDSERWYDYTYLDTSIENGLIPLYSQYEKDIKDRIKNYIS